MNKVTLSILTTVVTFPLLYAINYSQDTQTNTPTDSNAAVDDANLKLQNTEKTTDWANYQTQINHNDYSIPTVPTTEPDSANSSAAVDDRYNIGQNPTQNNTQDQIDLNQYLTY